MKPTELEIKVLKMLNKDLPQERGSWVNACVEFLGEMGYVSRQAPYRISERGKEFLRDLKRRLP